MSERDEQYDALRTVCNRQQERIADLERQVAQLENEVFDLRIFKGAIQCVVGGQDSIADLEQQVAILKRQLEEALLLNSSYGTT